MSNPRRAGDAAATNHSRDEMLGFSNGARNWLGWSAVGLVVALLAAAAWEQIGHEEPKSVPKEATPTGGAVLPAPAAAALSVDPHQPVAGDDSLLIWRPVRFEVLSVSGDVHVPPGALSRSFHGKECLIVLNKHDVGQLQVRMARDRSGKLSVTDVPNGQAAPSWVVDCLLGLRGKPLPVRGSLPTPPFSINVELRLSY
jgi:hypothetical protein